jgi:uncharacterized membrane protein
MSKAKNFIRTSILGGVAVILPAAILLLVFKWVFGIVTGLIQPLTNLVMSKSQIQEIIADILVLGVILTVCFFIGVVVKTKVGQFIYENLEKRILSFAPGYSMIKETVMQFLGKKRIPFSSVALVQVFENDTLMTAFITDHHADDSYTVFVPTGPNPTSGNIYHLKGQYVHHINVSIESTMRSIISCGAGSAKLIDAIAENRAGKEGHKPVNIDQPPRGL